MVSLNLEIPSEFYLEETRNGYTIPRKTKELWAVMLDLLAELDRVCKKHNLTYFANGGTLIGTIRHQGFIPWDDDLDVIMLRKDYDKLMEVGLEEFKHPYFLQNKYSEPNSPCFFAKIRNSNTTAFNADELYSIMDYNKGIFIDIFPLDVVPSDPEEDKIFREEIKKKREKVIKTGRSIGIFSDTNNKRKRIVKSVISKLLTNKRKKSLPTFIKEFKEFEELCSRYKNLNTGFLADVVYDADCTRFDAYDFADKIYLDFEFIKIPVIKGYHHHLTKLFGDYMKPVVSESHNSFYDTDKSYKYYI